MNFLFQDFLVTFLFSLFSFVVKLRRTNTFSIILMLGNVLQILDSSKRLSLIDYWTRLVLMFGSLTLFAKPRMFSSDTSQSVLGSMLYIQIRAMPFLDPNLLLAIPLWLLMI